MGEIRSMKELTKSSGANTGRRPARSGSHGCANANYGSSLALLEG